MKLCPVLLSALLSVAISGAFFQAEAAEVKVGASPTPHAEILKAAVPLMKAKGHDLKIVEYADYVQPNMALDAGELDANYFQHQPYLTDFNKEKGTKLVSIASVHYEPFGIYAGRTKSLSEIKKGAVVAVPNDTTNEARALLLLQSNGLIKLKEGAGLTATRRDIVENPNKLKIEELEAAQLVRSLPDVDFATINGNYAIQADLKVADALAIESAEGTAGTAYVNVLAVKEGNENTEKTQALLKALTSQEVKDFINDTYDGAVVAVF